MIIEFWGVRGTAPSPGRNKVRYGGHTTCASAKLGECEYLVIDAGTGIKDLGDRLTAESTAGRARGREPRPIHVHLLLTHFHLDHIMGFPFFGPLYSARASLDINAPATAKATETLLAGLTAGRRFPVDLGDTASAKTFRKVTTPMEFGNVRVTFCPLVHPQESVAYRLESGGRSIVFATDTEHPEEGVDRRLAEFAAGASYLVYDATFTPEEYAAGKKGWGHSTWLAGAELAAAAGVGHLVLSHFHPDHDDDRVDRYAGEARRRFPRTLAARQGLKLE